MDARACSIWWLGLSFSSAARIDDRLSLFWKLVKSSSEANEALKGRSNGCLVSWTSCFLGVLSPFSLNAVDFEPGRKLHQATTLQHASFSGPCCARRDRCSCMRRLLWPGESRPPYSPGATYATGRPERDHFAQPTLGMGSAQWSVSPCPCICPRG